MIIRTANTNDLKRIERIHRDSILQLCKTHYSAEQLADWTAALGQDAYVALLSSHHVFVAEESGELQGFAVFDSNTGLVNAT